MYCKCDLELVQQLPSSEQILIRLTLEDVTKAIYAFRQLQLRSTLSSPHPIDIFKNLHS